MTIPIADQHFVVLGLARQGLAVTRWLREHGAQVTVSDSKPEADLQDPIGSLRDLDVKFALGGHPLSLLEHCDVLCLSGGVPIDLPIVLEAQRRGIPLTNDAQLFVERCPAPIIGITGSAGKTTTTTLTGEILKAAHFTTWVGGNIGNPLIGDLADIMPTDRVVMELSSFQLDVMTVSPHVAAVLNITPNHLDRHPSMEAYIEAKRHILDHQSFDDIAVLGYDNDITRALSGSANGYVRFFSREKIVGRGAFLKGDRIIVVHNREEEVCRLGDILLRGDHNVLNVLAACAMTSALGVDVEPMAQAIREFKGVAHRLQLIREVNGVKYYDNSISTAPERLMADLQVFSEPIVLLAGGRDKHLPWEDAAQMIVERVRELIVFGEMADLVRGAVEAQLNRSDERTLEKIHQVTTLDEAVTTAAQIARSGEVVLLSPGGTSFDAFKDFAERGDKFQELVNGL
ncbi:MAG TPA: UDP-N-acetylmuramoyl-L-alanine--D-glutamate ligase [Anaerolineae bacterium]|nr:UDP-N-acetylmuramoyl-L-alanine--D-glutamate ligase [Anaerolineae bacterium]